MLLALALASPSGASLDDRFRGTVERIFADAFRETIARTLPIVAASPGVTFAYDPETGTYERSGSLSGQLYLERAQPIGRGKLNLSLSYQWMRIDTVDGRSIDGLRDVDPIRVARGGTLASFSVPRFDLGLITHQTVVSATYGIDADTDVNLAVPVLYDELTKRTTFTGHGRDGSTIPLGGSDASATAVGIGDLLVRIKRRMLQTWAGDVAAELRLRLPAGNPNDFQGTGTMEISPLLDTTSAPVTVGPVELHAHLNAGVDLPIDRLDAGAARWGIGADAVLSGGRMAAAVAILGRNGFGRIAPPGTLAFRRTSGQVLPLFGLQLGRPDYYDLAIGVRVNLWRQMLVAFANAIVPLNDDGFRSDVIPLIGLEVVP